MKRRGKYLVCKWGGKRNDSVDKYILWIWTCESQKAWACNHSSVKIPTAACRMDCGCKYQQSWALPAGTEQSQWSHCSVYTRSWATVLPSVNKNLLSPPPRCRAGSFLSPPFTGAQGIGLLNLCAHAREEERLLNSLPLLCRSNDILAPGCQPCFTNSWISTARFDSKLSLLDTIFWKGLINSFKILFQRHITIYLE